MSERPTRPAGPARERGWRGTAIAYARGAGGGMMLALPLLMTMEMWWSGFHMSTWRLLLFFAVNFGILVVLEHYSGFRDEDTFVDELQDAVAALGIGLSIAALVLFALARISPGMPWREIVGKVVLQSIPASIGASIAVSQLGVRSEQHEERKERAGFWGTQGIALAGAVVFGFNVAPTEEPMVLGMTMHWWHVLLLLALSLLVVHALVYAVEFRGSHVVPEGRTLLGHFFSTSVVSYIVALSMAAYLLWTFGRIGGDTGLMTALHMTVVLGFVTSLGAASAKLIL